MYYVSGWHTTIYENAENLAYFGRAITSLENIAKTGRNFNIYPGDSCVFLIISTYAGLEINISLQISEEPEKNWCGIGL